MSNPSRRSASSLNVLHLSMLILGVVALSMAFSMEFLIYGVDAAYMLHQQAELELPAIKMFYKLERYPIFKLVEYGTEFEMVENLAAM